MPGHRRVRALCALVAVVIFTAALAACTPPAQTSTAAPTDPLLSGLLSAMNNDRAGSGLPPYQWSPKLANQADTWSSRMAADNYLDHQDLAAMLASADDAEYLALGENLYLGPGTSSADTIESTWMASSPHRANILSTGFDSVGIGYYRGSDGRLWVTADFGEI